MILQLRYCIGRYGTCGRDLWFEKGGTMRLCAKCKKAQEFENMCHDLARKHAKQPSKANSPIETGAAAGSEGEEQDG